MSTCQNCGCKATSYRCEEFGKKCVHPHCLVGPADFCGKKMWPDDPTYFTKQERLEVLRAEVVAHDVRILKVDAQDSTPKASN